MRSDIPSIVNDLLESAVSGRASDVHFDPDREGLSVRFRIDGLLKDVERFSPDVRPLITSRIKILSGMDIAECRLPQDGRAALRSVSGEFDLRTATMPTVHGEKAVIRLLKKGTRPLAAEELGMSQVDLALFLRLISRPVGLIVVTGPTGSGKTTTLYSALNHIRSPKINIISIEDPVEYEIGGINQIQVNNKAGLTFPRGLRSILRLDPDVIMIGEIRDAETARIAIQSAMTGHLVISTMHTNDSASAIGRFLDLGIEPFLLSDCLSAVMAQRLVRVKCSCGGGCDECSQTGFKGRTGLFEIFSVDGRIRTLISARAPRDDIMESALGSGMKTMRDSGEEKVLAGITTKQEVLRTILPDQQGPH